MTRHLIKKLSAMVGFTLVTFLSCKAADLPPAKYTEWTVEKEIFVPMRDGVHLSTDVALPKGATGKLPTILVRTPYEFEKNVEGQQFYLKQGYAVVVQNERGRFFSEGYLKNEHQDAATDGYDTVDWIAKQPWSNGKVGTIGCSCSGGTQWPMATQNHPAHAAMVPGAVWEVGDVPGNETWGAFYRGGVPQFAVWSWWYNFLAPSERFLLPANSTQEQRNRLRNTYSLTANHFSTSKGSGFSQIEADKYFHLPSQDILRQFGAALTPYDEYIKLTPGDARWKEAGYIGAGTNPRVPALHLNSWFDPGATETVRLFKYLQDQGTPNQYLIMGAGPHCVFWKTDLGHFKFGDIDAGDVRYGGLDQGYQKLFLEWYDHWLRGEQNHVTEMPKVQLHVMGKGWISSDRWPLSQARNVSYYLNRDARSEQAVESGSLSTKPPARNSADSYLYDPGSPVPMRGGIGCCGFGDVAVDQRPVEMRKDVLVYSTPPLDKPVTVVGPIEVVLYVSSSAKDTDFMVKLVDVYPDGKSVNINDDAFRVRYREGFNKKVLMQSGQVYKITLDNMVASLQFAKGHRIRLDITSSNFPKHERNLNTGGNNYDETEWVVAENSVHHGGKYPSRVVLPVLPD